MLLAVVGSSSFSRTRMFLPPSLQTASTQAPPNPVRLVNGNFYQPERSEEHTYELQSLMRISYAVFCLKKKRQYQHTNKNIHSTQRKITEQRYRHADKQQPDSRTKNQSAT